MNQSNRYLPLDTRQLEAAAAHARPPALLSHHRWRRRALVVDDDRFARRMLGDALEDRGFEVVTAEDGLAGLRTLVDEILDLDVLVTDVFMPAMDGEELIRRIRIAGGERDLGIVVVSSADLDPARLCAIGADAVIGKGAGLEAIAQAVDVTSRTRGRDPA